MHLICESRLYTESSLYFAGEALVECSLFIKFQAKMYFISTGTYRHLESTTTHQIVQIRHQYNK